MPSLYPDPASLPPLPITSDRVLGIIHNALETLHKQEGVPPFYPSIDAAITRLVQAGMKISAKHESPEITDKLGAMAEASLHFGCVRGLIDRQLIRNRREIALQRCDNGHLSLWLALVDTWLASCEEYARKNCKRFAADVAAFDGAHEELTAVAVLHTAEKNYGFDNILQLFDSLGLTHT
ncbi:hypothetical protein F4779DRAFT_595885 [Xylariaceae sp. FL0662B]|nr:hypothetical protein F4779DRAFT_595885 [Xylariaceae sp. FL0662B]